MTGSASGNINRRSHLRSRRTIMNACGSIISLALGVVHLKQSQDEITLMHVDQQHIRALRWYIQGNHQSKKPLMQVDQSYPMHYDRQSMSNPKTIGEPVSRTNKWVWMGRREWLEEATEQGGDKLRIEGWVGVVPELPACRCQTYVTGSKGISYWESGKNV